MSWVRIDDKFPRNPKVMKAGPMACWLYICALCHCREHHTGGFLAAEALEYLGVKQAGRLAAALVLARLWDVVDGGWQVHGYDTFYEDEADKARAEHRRQVNRENGRLGGLAKAGKSVDGSLSDSVGSRLPNRSSDGLALIGTGTGNGSVRSSSSEKGQEIDERLDEAFLAFRAAYPPSRRKGGRDKTGRLVEELYMHAAHAAGGPNPLRAALANHLASEQWQTARLIPGMDVWFTEERWRQELPAASASKAGRGRTGAPTPGKYDGLEE